MKYIDSDGKIRRSANGHVIFWKPKSPGVGILSDGTEVKGYWGYIKGDDGTKITAFKVQENSKPETKSDCHGTIFADGVLWINNEDVDKLLKADNYKKRGEEEPSTGDVVVYRDDAGNVKHSGKVLSVDKKKGSIILMDKPGHATKKPVIQEISIKGKKSAGYKNPTYYYKEKKGQ